MHSAWAPNSMLYCWNILCQHIHTLPSSLHLHTDDQRWLLAVPARHHAGTLPYTGPEHLPGQHSQKHAGGLGWQSWWLHHTLTAGSYQYCSHVVRLAEGQGGASKINKTRHSSSDTENLTYPHWSVWWHHFYYKRCHHSLLPHCIIYCAASSIILLQVAHFSAYITQVWFISQSVSQYCSNNVARPFQYFPTCMTKCTNPFSQHDKDT